MRRIFNRRHLRYFHLRFNWILKFCLLTFFLILVYIEGPWRNNELTKDTPYCRTAERKIQYLFSVLKRYSVPENEYMNGGLPIIYIVTPTYDRLVQKAELTKLKNVLLLVPSVHWILVEDASTPSSMVTNFLSSAGIPFTHLYRETPKEWKLNAEDPRWLKPRGVLQRNEALRWLRSTKDLARDSVVYFADDDNTYSIELFAEMRYTTKVSVWPVGLAGGAEIERPSINSDGYVVGWLVNWRPDRPFALDMAGFAVSLRLLLENPLVYLRLESKRGFMESDFLKKLVTLRDLEPKADRCSKVYVWHTQTKEPKITTNISLLKSQ